MSKPMTREERRLRTLLSQISKLVDEAGLVEPPLSLVAIPQPILVSVQQAAALLGVATSTVNELTRSGELPAIRIGRRVLIRLESLHIFAKNLEANCRPD